MRLYWKLVFEIPWTEPKLDWLLKEFRLIVNKSIRVALEQRLHSRMRLARVAYAGFGREHNIYKQYIPSAFDFALRILKTYRRRFKQGKTASVPYVRKPVLVAENQSYRLDRTTGRLRIPIRGTEGVQLVLPLSEWHRSILEDPAWALGSLTVVPGRVVLAVRRTSPSAYEPVSAIALDTNEDSLDGVAVGSARARLTSLSFLGVREIQARHFRRRRRLARAKAQDRRVQRRLLARESARERRRVKQRLHLVSKRLVQFALASKSAIVLENLKLPSLHGKSRRMNRRLSSWPNREIHRQIEYKAALRGVPVIKVNPAWTSKTCPVCGARRRDRVGKDFVCLICDWEMDRQHNAALNILKTALASNEALARAVRFQPGALRDDVVSPLYDLLREGGGAREEPSGVELDAIPPFEISGDS